MTAAGAGRRVSQAAEPAAEGVRPDVDIARLVGVVPLRPRIPSATYRLMFGSAFRFEDARRVAPYLRALGISDLYASPYLKARPGSVHGYDVVDHNALNPDFGDERDYGQLTATLLRLGMGHVMDVVPNHMGVASSSNLAWMDVLQNGPGSRYAGFFDIDWHPIRIAPELQNKVLLPILGDPYGKVLEKQELRLVYESGRFSIRYRDSRLPITPRSLIPLLEGTVAILAEPRPENDGKLNELRSIITALGHLPSPTEATPDKVAEREREQEVIRRRIDSLVRSDHSVQSAIGETIEAYNGRVGDPDSFDAMDTLLNAQCYHLAYWRVAADEINYRRFFDINDLAAIRMEHPEVFQQAHRLVYQLLEEGKVTGLRIDHPDGLWDPKGYLMELQRGFFLRLCRREWSAQGGDGRSWEIAQPALRRAFEEQIASRRAPLFMIVEKILSGDERIREDWPVYGTTGYEFANAVNGIFVARENRKLFDNIYALFTGNRSAYRNIVNNDKKMIMLISLASEVNMLGYQLKRISSQNRWYRDFTLNGLTFAIREVIAALSVYRTYVRPDAALDRQDRVPVEAAVAEAKRRNPRTAPAIFDFISDVLLQRYPTNLPRSQEQEWIDFAMKFQQTTGPVMAKGVEDTAFYRYNRLLSLNEVGGDAGQFGITVGGFHRQNANRLRLWPHSLLTTTTHDTKRSEDVRARINVLSELPREWKAALGRWSSLNRDKKAIVDGAEAPDADEEYSFYQTLLGVWPFEAVQRDDLTGRLQAYLLKAVKEAKVNTSWINPNLEYERAVSDFVAQVLDPERSADFRADFESLRRTVAHFGIFNSLGQMLLKITSPGVPDFYQGTELWDFSLVDPDNRRPVDFKKRERALNALAREVERDALTDIARKLLASKEDGRIKLFLMQRALCFRESNIDLFREGEYLPVLAVGAMGSHLCAFLRRKGRAVVLVAVPRLVARLCDSALVPPVGPDVWQDTALLLPRAMTGVYRNVLTGEQVGASRREGRWTLDLASVLSSFPVGLLELIRSDK